MRKVLVLVLALLLSLPLSAAGQVTYDGGAQKFIFEPGSEYSPTDLFSDFKDVMPGDSITQKISVRSDVSEQKKVTVYLRALGAEEGSEEFLSQLTLRAAKSGDAAYMFDAPADQTAQLTDWVCLGTLYAGGAVDLDVTLDVPTSMGSEFADAVGYLDWEFKVEEFPSEDGDPDPPQTGDSSNPALWIAVMAAASCALIAVAGKKQRKNV